MFTAILICSDDDCDHVEEFVGTLDAIDSVLCEGCDCVMQVIALEGGAEAALVVSLPSRRARQAGAPTSLAA